MSIVVGPWCLLSGGSLNGGSLNGGSYVMKPPFNVSADQCSAAPPVPSICVCFWGGALKMRGSLFLGETLFPHRGSCHLFNPPLTSVGFKREAFRKTKRRSMPPALRRHRRQFCNISFVTSPGSGIWRWLLPTMDSTAAFIVRGLPAVPRCCGPCR